MNALDSCGFVSGSVIQVKEYFWSDMKMCKLNGTTGVWLKGSRDGGIGRLIVMGRIKKGQKHEYLWANVIDLKWESRYLKHLSQFKPLTVKPKMVTLEFEKPLVQLEKKIIDNKEGLGLVRDILMKTPEMNIRLEASSFQILITALCRTRKVDCVVELLGIMQLNECIPDASLYSSVLHSLCKHADSVEIMRFMQEMRKAGLFPNLVEYNGVINALIREEKVYDACSVLAQMRSEGTRPDIQDVLLLVD